MLSPGTSRSSTRSGLTGPPRRGGRALAIVQVAVYDAVIASSAARPYAVGPLRRRGRRPRRRPPPRRIAAWSACSRPGRRPSTPPWRPRGRHPRRPTPRPRGSPWDPFVAGEILALRPVDGADGRDLRRERRANGGRPRPASPRLLPQWPTVVPSRCNRRPVPPGRPPPQNSAQYAADFAEVQRLGRANSTARTAEQTLIARFWADGTGTATPPGHWNQIAQDVARRSGDPGRERPPLRTAGHGPGRRGIVSWDAKYPFGFWRPITAIRLADADGNPETVPDPDWTPLLVTPPFPTYTSGHSTFSGAPRGSWAFFGRQRLSTTDTDDLPGVTRSFTSFARRPRRRGGAGSTAASTSSSTTATACPPVGTLGRVCLLQLPHAGRLAVAPARPVPRRPCLNGGRFKVEANWHDGTGLGSGPVLSQNGNSGQFYLHRPGQHRPGRQGAQPLQRERPLRGVRQRPHRRGGPVTVTDTQTGQTRRYFNPAGEGVPPGAGRRRVRLSMTCQREEDPVLDKLMKPG